MSTADESLIFILSYIYKPLLFLDTHVRKPLSDTPFDNWIATPTKEYYLKTVKGVKKD
jgi:hypothetical protein|tara:strand:+ start:980 stop:1153 length:174 start_codon:yes stop_codon:yes gene_type:complete